MCERRGAVHLRHVHRRHRGHSERHGDFRVGHRLPRLLHDGLDLVVARRRRGERSECDVEPLRVRGRCRRVARSAAIVAARGADQHSGRDGDDRGERRTKMGARVCPHLRCIGCSTTRQLRRHRRRFRPFGQDSCEVLDQCQYVLRQNCAPARIILRMRLPALDVTPERSVHSSPWQMLTHEDQPLPARWQHRGRSVRLASLRLQQRCAYQDRGRDTLRLDGAGQARRATSPRLSCRLCCRRARMSSPIANRHGSGTARRRRRGIPPIVGVAISHDFHAEPGREHVAVATARSHRQSELGRSRNRAIEDRVHAARPRRDVRAHGG